MFLQIDAYIFDRVPGFEKITHASQRYLGLDNFFWTRFCIAVYIAHVVWISSAALSEATEAVPPIFFFSIVLLALMLGGAFWFSYYVEKRTRNKTATMNFVRSSVVAIFYRLVQVMFLAISVVEVLVGTPLSLFGLLWDVLTVNIVYFISCTPLPPQRSKLREWLGNLGRKNAEI